MNWIFPSAFLFLYGGQVKSSVMGSVESLLPLQLFFTCVEGACGILCRCTSFSSGDAGILKCLHSFSFFFLHIPAHMHTSFFHFWTQTGHEAEWAAAGRSHFTFSSSHFPMSLLRCITLLFALLEPVRSIHFLFRCKMSFHASLRSVLGGQPSWLTSNKICYVT